jgi:hypothetical protein
MATPLNTFQTITTSLTTTNTLIYTTPANTTSIILLAQCANITGSAVNVTAAHFDGTSSNVELIKNFAIPGNDAVGLLTGKLVLEAGQSLYANASANSSLKLTVSLIESI